MNHQIKRAFMAMLLSVFCFVAYAQKIMLRRQSQEL